MKIFIASSKESVDLMRDIEMWVEEASYEPIPWDQPALFPPGEQTLLTLINISKQVDAAICVFGEDDKIWYRGDTAAQPRDNILIEYGLFVGTLGPKKAVICRNGAPKQSSDLLGITFFDLTQKRRARGRMEILAWLRKLGSSPVDPATAKLIGRVHELEQEKELLEQKISFEKGKTQDLETLLREGNIVDFSKIDINKDGHWKLLYNDRYFNGVAEILVKYSMSTNIKSLLIDFGIEEVVDKIAWGHEQTLGGNVFMTRKALRVFRRYSGGETFLQFINNFPDSVRNEYTELALSVLNQTKMDNLFV
jgi:hypothetical protein